MGFFSLYIIIMSRDDEEYLDDPEIVDFNEELDARAARSMEEDEIPISPLMFGPTGRGMSPEMELTATRKLHSDSAKALRREGIDYSHLEDPTNLALNEQQIEEAEAKEFDDMLDRMYKRMRKPVKSATRPKNMPNSKLPPRSSKKGGTRKRSSTRKRRRSTKKRSTRRRRR